MKIKFSLIKDYYKLYIESMSTPSQILELANNFEIENSQIKGEIFRAYFIKRLMCHGTNEKTNNLGYDQV